MNKLLIALTLFLCFSLVFTGYVLRDLEGQYVADRDLTGKIQECIADRNGFEQLYNTANDGIKTEEYLTINPVSVS